MPGIFASWPGSRTDPAGRAGLAPLVLQDGPAAAFTGPAGPAQAHAGGGEALRVEGLDEVAAVVGETLGRLITDARLRARHRNAIHLRDKQASVGLVT